MMNRVRRSGGRQKSPSSSEESYTINKSSGTFSVGIGGSPILTHRPSGTTAGGLGMAYAINFGGGGGYKSTQQQVNLSPMVGRGVVGKGGIYHTFTELQWPLEIPSPKCDT